MRSSFIAHARIQRGDWDPSMTKQAMADECDINKIMKRYEKTGMLNHVIRYKGQYADVSTEHDYQSALQTIIDANVMFDSLPAAVREKFANDPAGFLAFVEDPSNHDEMAELGLLSPTRPDPAAPPPAPGPGPLGPEAIPSPQPEVVAP